MSDRTASTERPDPGDRRMTGAYVGVIVVQVVALVGLWIFQAYFSH